MAIKLNKRDIEIFNFNNLIRKRGRIVLNQPVTGSSGGGTPDTSSDGKQVFLIIGDSIAAGGNSGGDQTLPSSGTAYEWVSSAIAEFGSNSMSTPGGVNKRSIWAKFCIDYYTDTGNKPVIVNRGYGSSSISQANDNNDWTSTGINRANAIADANDCIAAVGVTKLKGIFIVLGINDVQNLNGTGSNSVSTISTAYSNLIDALISAFGSDVPILFCQLGRTNSITVSSRLSGVRNAIKQKCIAYDNVHLCAALGAFTVGSLYSSVPGPNIHPSISGNDYLGSMFARWYKNSAYSKWARSIISAHFDEISSAYKDRIEDFISTYQVAYLGFDFAYFTKSSLKLNAAFDWAFLCGAESDGGFTFSADDYVATNGSNQLFNWGYSESLSAINCSQNDNFTACKIKTNSSGAVNAFAWGISSATCIEYLRHNSGVNVIWAANCGPANAKGWTEQTTLSPGEYIVRRTGSTTRNLLKDGSSVDSDSVASVAFVDSNMYAGALNLSGTPTAYLNAQYHRFIRGKASLISDWAAFYSALNTLQGL